MTQQNASLKAPSTRELLLEFQELRSKLDEAEATLDAIRTGEVDALIVNGQNGQQVYTLKGANENYRIFVERMQEGAATLDSEGLILYCNRSMAEMAGRPLEVVIGHSFVELLAPEFKQDFVDLMARASEQLDRSEAVISGPTYQVPVILSLSRLDNEGLEGFALTATDLSAQKAHEHQLQQANAELQGFCYSISHDLRTPLRSMVSAAGIVLEDYGELLPSDAHEELNRIKAAGNHLGYLIDDLLTYARIQRHALNMEPLNISEMSQKIASSLEGSQDVCWEIADSMTGYGDPRLVQVVLDNLLSNAVKYSSHSPQPKVQVGEANLSEGPAFFVKDNGIGFDMAYIDKIFAPFERLHTHDQFPGTGIGLANVQRILTRHGGRVWATSEVGKGATFYFTMPGNASAVVNTAFDS